MNDKLGNVRKIDHLMAAERDFGERPPQGTTYRYVICSSPRCGSNLVGQMLRDTGLAGDPLEYLNARLMAGFARSKGQSGGKMDLGAYLAEMESRRTSPNGVFGAKVHYEHLLYVWKGREDEAARWLRGYDKRILLRRRDKIAQAVSLHKARVTQLWAAEDVQFLDEDDPRRSRKAEYSASDIARALFDLIVQEEGWRAFLDRHGLEYLSLCYEDFVADYAGQSAVLLGALGIAPGQAPQAPRLARQGRDDDPMITAFRRDIGLAAPAGTAGVAGR